MTQSSSVQSAPGPASGAVLCSSSVGKLRLHPPLPSPALLHFNQSGFASCLSCTAPLQSPAPNVAVAELTHWQSYMALFLSLFLFL